jgi:hypothetical protein
MIIKMFGKVWERPQKFVPSKPPMTEQMREQWWDWFCEQNPGNSSCKVYDT